jgi:hypothetical protein
MLRVPASVAPECSTATHGRVQLVLYKNICLKRSENLNFLQLLRFHALFQLFNIYIKKAAEIYGVPKTRQIYEKAIEVLTEENAREMCLRFAEMETKLGEIDRARAIYAHCSQMCDPRVCYFSSCSFHFHVHFHQFTCDDLKAKMMAEFLNFVFS